MTLVTQIAIHWAVVCVGEGQLVTTTMEGGLDKHDVTQVRTLCVQLCEDSHQTLSCVL